MIKNKILHPTKNNEDDKNPFELAKEKNQLREINLQNRVNSLKMMFILVSILAILILLSFFILINKPTVVPYVIEVSPSGNVINYGKMAGIDNLELSNETIKKCIFEFLYNIRRIDNDIVVIKRNWTTAYNYATKNSKKILDKMFNEINPLKNYKEYLIDIKITSYLNKSDKAKEIEFIETKYALNGAVLERKKYRCLLTFKLASNLISDLNPEGFFIDSFVIGEMK